MNLHEYIEKVAISRKSLKKQYRRAIKIMRENKSASHGTGGIKSMMDSGFVDARGGLTGIGSYWMDHKIGKIGNEYFTKHPHNRGGLVISKRSPLLDIDHTVPRERVNSITVSDNPLYGKKVKNPDGSVTVKASSYPVGDKHHIRSGKVKLKKGMTVVGDPRTIGISNYKKTRVRQINPHVWEYAKARMKANKEWGMELQDFPSLTAKNMMENIRIGRAPSSYTFFPPRRRRK